MKASYSGGRFYGGGAAVPYTSGMRSPGSISPYLLAGGTLGFVGGAWVYGAWAYPYGHPSVYHNDTANRNETLPVECGCDSNNDTSYVNDVVNNRLTSKAMGRQWDDYVSY